MKSHRQVIPTGLRWRISYSNELWYSSTTTSSTTRNSKLKYGVSGRARISNCGLSAGFRSCHRANLNGSSIPVTPSGSSWAGRTCGPGRPSHTGASCTRRTSRTSCASRPGHTGASCTSGTGCTPGDSKGEHGIAGGTYVDYAGRGARLTSGHGTDSHSGIFTGRALWAYRPRAAADRRAGRRTRPRAGRRTTAIVGTIYIQIKYPNLDKILDYSTASI